MTECVGSAVGKAKALYRTHEPKAFGSDGPDTFDSGPGNDVVCGRGGDDILIGDALWCLN